ncbi:MAG: Fic family protein [Candidatus Sumerlaeia bacterium]|nr:Fic family protein [Candidatus Sumerlaeia bacterium]
MKRGITGILSHNNESGELVRTFIPNPLPPNPPVILEGALQLRFEKALLACGRLDSITTFLPEPDLFLYTYVRREAVLSSQIEGTQSSLSDLLMFEVDEFPGVPFDDVTEVSRYVAALDHGMQRLRSGFPLCNRLLREVHGILLSQGRGQHLQPGEFRRSQNWIGGTRPGNAAYVPPPPHEVEPCMAALERFLHEDASYSALLKAAYAHVQFETIHPFLDGNGRLGRLLIALILHQEKVLRQPLLYLSLFFKTHRSHYYDLLTRVREEGDWEAWLNFFLEGVEVTATAVVETTLQLLELFRKDRLRVEESGRAAANALRVFEGFLRRPINSINTLSIQTELSFPTVARALELLANQGIVKEITGRQRGRLYVYTEYLELLNQGTDRPHRRG